jgi:hypothetical protein
MQLIRFLWIPYERVFLVNQLDSLSTQVAAASSTKGVNSNRLAKNGALSRQKIAKIFMDSVTTALIGKNAYAATTGFFPITDGNQWLINRQNNRVIATTQFVQYSDYVTGACAKAIATGVAVAPPIAAACVILKVATTVTNMVNDLAMAETGTIKSFNILAGPASNVTINTIPCHMVFIPT